MLYWLMSICLREVSASAAGGYPVPNNPSFPEAINIGMLYSQIFIV